MEENSETNNSFYSEEMDIFSNFLKRKGLKITHQRQVVAEKIFSQHSHFTADSLLDMFRDRRDEISKATIYRIIGIMLEANLLVEHDFGKGFKYYEHIIGHDHHDHIICIDCNRIVEFINPKIEDLQVDEAEKNGFSIKAHSLIIHGSCFKKTDCEHFKEYSKRH